MWQKEQNSAVDPLSTPTPYGQSVIRYRQFKSVHVGYTFKHRRAAEQEGYSTCSFSAYMVKPRRFVKDIKPHGNYRNLVMLYHTLDALRRPLSTSMTLRIRVLCLVWLLLLPVSLSLVVVLV